MSDRDRFYYPVIDYLAKNLPANKFPTAGKTLLETLQGNKSDITENSFSKEELEELKQLIKSKQSRTGGFSYKDYYKYSEDKRKATGKLHGDTFPSLLSLFDPYGNVQTTLGRFNYKETPTGTVVQDNYDFNPVSLDSTMDPVGFGPYAMIREYAGVRIPPGKGRKVNINLGNLYE